VLSGDAAAVDTEAPGLVGEAALGFTKKLEVLAAGMGRQQELDVAKRRCPI
jgi:hypothetical protein